MQYGYWKVRVIQKHRIPTSVRHLVPASFVLLLTVLPLASLAWPIVAWGWLGLLGMYAMCSISTSFRIAAHTEWNLLPILPLVFACYHLAYGYGFLRGLWDFAILRRGAHRTYTELTRARARQLSRNTTVD
jgi:succinoglycan biosynthesis protein ExoA